MRNRIAIALFSACLCAAACGTTKENSVAKQTETRGADPGGAGQAGAAGQGANVHVKHYEKYLGDKRTKGSEIAEEESLRIGDWRFFYMYDQRRPKMNAVAVSGGGQVLAPNVTKDHFFAFLSTEGLDGQGALQRLAWLLGAIPVDKSAKDFSAEVQAVVTDPVLERQADGGVRFVGWMAMPPNVDNPSRLTLTAPKTGEAATQFLGWEEVAQGAP